MAARRGFYFNHVSEQKLQKIIKDFTACGWEYFSLSRLGEGILLEFNWKTDDKPVIPNGYSNQN